MQGSLFRYPGAKNKIADRIVSWFQPYFGSSPGPEYREPFFGGGAVGLALMKAFPGLERVWLNDYDPSLCSVWDCVLNHAEDLITELHMHQRWHLNFYQHPRDATHREPRLKFCPTDCDFDSELETYLDLPPKQRPKERPESYKAYIDAYLKPFYDAQECVREARTIPKDLRERVRLAFQKIMIHQTSYSGLGTASGPIGGKWQDSDWIMGCRYMPETTEKKVRQIRALLSTRNFHDSVCTNLDFMKLLHADGDCVFYLDPPYYNQGHKLYRETFRQKHEELAEWLVREDRPWLLSYDNADEVRRLYDAPHLEMHAFPLRYTVTRYRNEDGSAVEKTDDQTKWELVITNRPGTIDMFRSPVACNADSDVAE